MKSPALAPNSLALSTNTLLKFILQDLISFLYHWKILLSLHSPQPMIQIKTLAFPCQALDPDMESQVVIISKLFSSGSLLFLGNFSC